MSSEGYVARTVRADGREFSVLIVRLSNGCFTAISEGSSHRMGSVNVSLAGAKGVNTAKVIPSRYDALFLNVISERMASMTKGICIVSLYTASALNLKAMESIMENITDAIGATYGSS